VEKVRQGVTSMEEILRRTVAHRESLPVYLVNPDVEDDEDGAMMIREGNTTNIDFFKLIRGGLTVKGGKRSPS
jgi:type IV pilus assembly protein PilB